MKRFRSRRLKYSKRKLEFKLAPLRVFTFSYGQQHTVPNAVAGIECVYWVTEQTNPANTSRVQTITRCLQGITDIQNLASWMWMAQPTNVTPTLNPGWNYDQVYGDLYVMGNDLYTLRNQSNETVRITAYECTARQNQLFDPTPTNLPPQTVNNKYAYLASGWAENGLDINSQFATSSIMTRDEVTPFMSRMFTRNFKINRVRRIFIRPGGIKKLILRSRWRRHVPADYVTSQGSANAWTNRETRFDTLKGERFILFKLHGNIGGIDAQATMEKNISQTTPTVIMHTKRVYRCKHRPRPIGGAVNFTDVGFGSGTASIIVDADEQKGAEIDAS